jgi:hypothetical protein
LASAVALSAAAKVLAMPVIPAHPNTHAHVSLNLTINSISPIQVNTS